MKAKVIITPKAEVLDPQGQTVQGALEQMGCVGVREVRIGKYIEIEMDGDRADVEKSLDEYAERSEGSGFEVVGVRTDEQVIAADRPGTGGGIWAGVFYGDAHAGIRFLVDTFGVDLYENGVWAIFSTLDPRVLQFKPGVLMTADLCAEVLERVRTAIETAPVEPGLVAKVRARVERWRAETAPLFAGFDDVVFRSSSNCEDLPGFNGAGLADSYRAGAPITDDLVADRLRQVWASLWSDRGYAERAAFGIDQSDAAMAVLVQPVVPHAAHVVAITTNTVKPGAIDAYFLNLLPSGSLVTDAASDTAEQLLLFDDDPACAEVLCFAGGRDASLLPDALLGPARDMLKTLDRRVRQEARGACRAADVEFLVLDQPHGAGVVLLQARPWGAADARR